MIKKFLKIYLIVGKYNFFLLFIIILILPLLDFISIGLLIPLIKLVVNNSSIFEFSVFSQNLSFNINNIVYLLLFISLLKLSLIIFSQRFQVSKIWDLGNQLKKNILINYINSDFEFIINENSSIMTRNINSEVSNFLHNYFVPMLNIFSNIFLIFFMSILVFIVNFKAACILFFFFLLLFLLNKKILNPILKKLGYQRQINQSDLLKLLTNIFHFIREIKFYNLKNLFIKKLDINNDFGKNINISRATIDSLPRIVSEALFVTIFCFLILFNKNNEQFITTLGIYVVVAVRMIPSINSFINSYLRVKNAKASFEIIYKNIDLKNHARDEFISKRKSIGNIEINKLNFKYINNKIYTIENLNLLITPKDKICISGESGSGKSTFVNLLLGFLKPEDDNSIKVSGIPIHKNISDWRRKISYVPQNIIILEATLEQNIIFSDLKNTIDKKKLSDCIRNANLNNLVNKMNGLNIKNFGEGGSFLSIGERQRVGIARALYRDADILILDEVTNHLDKENKFLIINNILEMYKNKIVISISHDENVNRFFKKKYLFKNKKIFNI